MIRAEDLAKRFGEIRAVDGVSFEVRSGEIYGLLGPNGAGKTTTMSMIAGLLAPDAGRITFDGVDLAADPILFKSRLGVVPQEVAIYEELTARENLRFWGGMYGLGGRKLRQAIDEALDLVGLTGRSKEPVKGFSGGMKRRLNLSLGLIHQPQAVLMDEPTVGIDPQAREKLLDVVKRVAENGTSVLYTTHYLEEAERLCQRIGIIDQGRILAEGTLEELQHMVGEAEVVTLRGGFIVDKAREKLEALAGVRLISAEEGRLVLATEGEGRGAAELLGVIYQQGIPIDSVSIEPPSLNGLFLKLTGRALRD